MAVNLIFKAMPTVALRGIVVFPGTRFHFDVGRKKSIEAINAAMSNNQKLFLVAQKDINVENPESGDLFEMGVIANIRQVIKAPDADYMRVIVEGECRAQISEAICPETNEKYYLSSIKKHRTSIETARVESERRRFLHDRFAEAQYHFRNITVITSGGEPICPKCGKPMRKMIAHKGRNAGNPFWSCTGYPNCNGTRNIIG